MDTVLLILMSLVQARDAVANILRHQQQGVRRIHWLLTRYPSDLHVRRKEQSLSFPEVMAYARKHLSGHSHIQSAGEYLLAETLIKLVPITPRSRQD